jgi:ATP-dependent helicase/nuclease subunit A
MKRKSGHLWLRRLRNLSSTKWTKEQQAAIDTRDCNLLVAAAAGAGKTAVLVERIIKKITNEDRPVDIDRLLVVTFTNAAASEMRERIGDAISQALDKNPDSKRLQNQLTLLNKASITTIHSFCLEVIKNNFHKIDLDPNFRIGDETETLLLKMEALEELFDEWYEKEDKEDFLSLVESYGGNRDDSGLQDIILKLHNFARSSPWPEKWLYEASERFNIGDDFKFGDSDWAKVLLHDVSIRLIGFEKKMKKAISIIKTTDGLEGYLPTFEKDLKDIQMLLSCCNTSWDSLYNVLDGFGFAKLSGRVKDAPQEAKELVKGIRDNIKKEIGKIQEQIFAFNNQDIVREIKWLYPMMKCLSSLVLDFDKRYSAKKREKGIIDFNDIEHFALSILTETVDGEIVPSDVALQYREKYDEILIDEYQDSNLVQEVLLDTISRKDPPNRFMVGDVKQSIYRFRQAKPELFLEKYNSYSSLEGEKNRKITLYKNFRSRSEIIEGVNYIFKRIMSLNIGELEYTDEEKLNLGADYKNIEDEESITGGPIEVHIIEKSVKEAISEEEIGEALTEEEEEPLDNVQLEARMVAQRIKELMKGEEGKTFKVYDKSLKVYRPLQFRDIVILLRATSGWAPIFLDELTKAGIPVFADTGTGYFETTEIKTILSLLEIIDNPMQDIPLIAVLRSSIFSFTAEELIDIRLEDMEGPFYEALKKAAAKEEALGKRAQEVLKSLKRWQDKSLHMSIDEFLWYLYTETGYYGYVGAMPGGEQRQANLKILFERAKQYEDTSFKGLFNFINFINKLKTSSGDMGEAKILGENEDVVRIMSIHKSKGLEFPVVIMSGAGKQFNLQDLTKSILFHHQLGFGPNYVDYKRRIYYPSIAKEAIKRKIKIESLSEEMRILYVAFTRAKEKLIITGSVNDVKKSLDNWNVDLEDGFKVPEYEVMKAKTYLDWICPAIIHHRDCAGVMGADEVHSEDELSKWKVKIWSREEVLSNSQNEEKEKRDILKELQEINLSQMSSEFSEEIVRRLDYKYPYMRSTSLPAKLSVTEIKRLINIEALDEVSTTMFGSISLKTPTFLQGKTSLTPAERGTIMHLVMQSLNLNRVSSYKEIKEQIEKMVEAELLTEEQAKTVNIKKIEDFFKSPLGQRMISSSNIRREVPFHIELSSRLVYKDLPEEYENENIAVQGIIDCFFEEDGEIVLLDYKTDYVNDNNVDEIKEKYKVQIELYGKALEKITGKRVKEKYIYLFYNGEIINF